MPTNETLKSKKVIRQVLPIVLLLSVTGEFYRLIHPKEFTSTQTLPTEFVAQLRYATLPSFLRPLAVHYWFVVFSPEIKEWERWELWQDTNAGGTSWGHIHKNLMYPGDGVGGGPSVIEMEWRGAVAQNIYAVLNAPARYPYRDVYLPWPGPNSNTYIAWILRQSQAAYDLDPRAIGKDYLGYLGGSVTTTGTGLQIESPVLGVKVGFYDGVELHLLCFTLGIDVWTPALKTPVGRFGFPD